MISFLEVNGIICTSDDLIEVGFSLADGKMNYEELLKWINNHKDLQ